MDYRKRLFEVIEIAEEDDKVSNIYDAFMMISIIASIVPMAFKTTNMVFEIVDKVTVGIFIVDYFFRILTADLKSHKYGKRGFPGYEKICIDILTYLFEDVLCEIKPQKYSNKELFRFDAVARIKNGDKSDFWNIVENNYNSRFILFEFKNYNEQIGQNQIYTTEKYLYDKALRRVGIVISRNGANENALWAAKGCLRESGKLILNLCDDDLISMLNLKDKGEDSSDYLMKILEDLLLQLEK